MPRSPEEGPERAVTVSVTLTAAERGDLESLAFQRSPVDAKTLLACFVGDLVASDKSGGSDERMFARQWLDRRFGPEWYARENYGKEES